jgi:hypothetical protein
MFKFKIFDKFNYNHRFLKNSKIFKFLNCLLILYINYTIIDPKQIHFYFFIHIDFCANNTI